MFCQISKNVNLNIILKEKRIATAVNMHVLAVGFCSKNRPSQMLEAIVFVYATKFEIPELFNFSLSLIKKFDQNSKIKHCKYRVFTSQHFLMWCNYRVHFYLRKSELNFHITLLSTDNTINWKYSILFLELRLWKIRIDTLFN